MASLAIAAPAYSAFKSGLSLKTRNSPSRSSTSSHVVRKLPINAMLATADASTGLVCHLIPELVTGTSCQLFPELVEGATCECTPDLVLGPCCVLTTADVGLEDVKMPTPTLPSGTMMAEFLLAYRRLLEHECESGDKVAAVGENVLERIWVGLNGLLHHPQHGASRTAGWMWEQAEHDVESCLWELEKDMQMFHRYHDRMPAPVAVKLTGLHCSEAARLLRRL